MQKTLQHISGAPVLKSDRFDLKAAFYDFFIPKICGLDERPTGCSLFGIWRGLYA